MDVSTASAEITDIRRELDVAADDILSLVEIGLRLSQGARTDAAAIETVFTALLQTCSFQDILGQRLERLGSLLVAQAEVRPDAALLNGPAAPGAGLDQVAADRLFDDLRA